MFGLDDTGGPVSAAGLCDPNGEDMEPARQRRRPWS
jgi:hypothetical protein